MHWNITSQSFWLKHPPWLFNIEPKEAEHPQSWCIWHFEIIKKNLLTIFTDFFFSLFQIFTYVVVGLGFTLFFSGLIGWVGGASESPCLVRLFLFSVVLSMIAEIGGIISLNIVRMEVSFEKKPRNHPLIVVSFSRKKSLWKKNGKFMRWSLSENWKTYAMKCVKFSMAVHRFDEISKGC